MHLKQHRSVPVQWLEAHDVMDPMLSLSHKCCMGFKSGLKAGQSILTMLLQYKKSYGKRVLWALPWPAGKPFPVSQPWMA